MAITLFPLFFDGFRKLFDILYDHELHGYQQESTPCLGLCTVLNDSFSFAFTMQKLAGYTICEFFNNGRSCKRIEGTLGENTCHQFFYDVRGYAIPL